jgi:hypothetical protein
MRINEGILYTQAGAMNDVARVCEANGVAAVGGRDQGATE